MNTSSFFLPAKTPVQAASFLLGEKGSGKFVLTLNTELLARGLSDSDFADLIQSAPYRVCDSIGAKGIFRSCFPASEISRIAGVDLGSAVLSLCAQRKIPVFLLGGREGIAVRAKELLTEDYPDLIVAGTCHGYFAPHEQAAVRGAIRRSGARVVLICLGSPRQEQWILENRKGLGDVELFLPLGGSMDVYAHAVLRAPLLWRRLGMEWLFRLLTAPDAGRRLHRLTSSVWVLFRKHREWKPFLEKMRSNCVELNNRL